MSVDVAMDERVLLARAFLSRVCEPGLRAVWEFVEEVGAVEAAAAIRLGRVPDSVASVTVARRDAVDPGADLDAAEAKGARLVTPESGDWPYFALAGLVGCQDSAPPLALWVRGPGDVANLGMRSVGIVGSRSATQYGVQVTAELAYGLAELGVLVISGGAYGIDAVAHRAALAASGQTVIVSAAGIDLSYPRTNAALFTEAAANGLVISEHPPGCSPHRSRFLTRNRLIAAFSTGVVVVECALRSGARNTAGHANAQGRPLMIVPGPVTSAMSAGCHDMLRDESKSTLLVTSVNDVLEIVGAAGEATVVTDALERRAGDLRDALDALDPAARRVVDGLLTRRFLGVAEIARRSGVAIPAVIRALPGLELGGLIEAGGAGGVEYRVAKRP